MPDFIVQTDQGPVHVRAANAAEAGHIAERLPPDAFAGAHVEGRQGPAPSGPSLPPPNPADPGSAALWMLGTAAHAGRQAAEHLTGRHQGTFRTGNPILDAVIGAGAGASNSISGAASAMIDPQGAINGAQSTVNHLAPVVMGTLNGQSGDQQSAQIARMEAARRGAGNISSDERAIKPDYAPSTWEGRMGERVGAALPYAALPEANLPTLMSVLGGEAGRGAAHMVGGNADQAGAAGFAGGVLGGLAATPVTGPAPSERLINDRTRQLSLTDAPDSHLAQAQSLMEDARNLPNGGITLHGDEGLAQVGGPAAAPLQALVRQASRAPGGQAGAAEQMTPRPQQVVDATLGTADLIAPEIRDPAMVGTTAQRGANDALSQIRTDTNTPARPSYDALHGQSLPQPEFEALMANPTIRAALERVTQNPHLRPLLQVGGNGEIPLNDLNTLNLVRQELTTMEQGATQSPTNPGGNNTEAMMMERAGSALDAVASRVSPEWSRANRIVSTGRRVFLEPAQAGPLGDIAGTNQALQQGRSLYPSAPPEGQPNVTVEALRGLEGEAPGTGADLTRLRLVDALDRGTRRNQGGANLRGGANVANDIAGNRMGGETFRAGVNEVAPNASPTVDTLIQALQATGTRAAEGSATATDTAAMESLGAGELPVEGAKAIFTPHQIPNRFGRWLDSRQINSNAGEIMRVMGLPPDEFAAYMRRIPDAATRSRVTGLIKALAATNAEQQVR